MLALASLVPILLALDGVASAASLSKRFVDHAVHETRNGKLPSGWQKRTVEKRSSTSAFDKKEVKLPFKLHLAQRNLDRADELLMDVSDPSSENYGNHWTPAQIMDMFAPAKSSIEAVADWLKEAGIPTHRIKYSKPQGAILVDGMSIAEAEELLQTTYDVYDHDKTGAPHIACDRYSVPKAVKAHLDFITPTVHFDTHLGKRDATTPVAAGGNDDNNSTEAAQKHPVQKGLAKDIGRQKTLGSSNSPVSLKTDGFFDRLFPDTKNCVNQTTPACLQLLYEYSPDFQGATSKNSYGIVEYTPQSYVPSDVDVFAKNFSSKLLGYRPKFASIDGGVLVTDSTGFDINGESNLDIQYGAAVVRPLNITLFQVGDLVEGASFNNFLNGIDASYCTYEGGNDPTQDATYPDPYGGGFEGPEECGKFKPTNVISTSYGYNEADLTPAYEQRQCNEYMKLGLMGVSVLYSSGDYGVAGNGGECIDPATGQYTPDGITFNPAFPSTCPYVTSVGATQTMGKNPFYYEGACEQVIYSGGGFSNNFPIPSYQKSAVASYFKNHLPSYNSTQYNNSQVTRGYPDISANGANYAVAIGGKFYRVFGTSASSPVTGGIISLLNDVRLRAGKKPLGFLNPFLYSHSWALNDITQGGNQGCGTPGFTAVKGWDPVTGLGTPNVPKLLIALAGLK